VTELPVWSVLLLPLVVGVFAAATAAADRALAAAESGRPVARDVVTGPWRDAARLLVTQRRTTRAPDALLWRLGGGLLVTAGLLAAVVVPMGGHVLADLSVGVVWFNAMEVLVWVAVWLLGWGPNSAYGLVGGYRFFAQGLAYELPLMFALVVPAMGAQSLRVADVVAAQGTVWFVVWMPVAFVVYLASVLAFAFRGPLAHPALADLGGGVLAEPSGVDRLVVVAGRYVLLVVGAAMAVPLFLGGGAGPLLPGWLWSALKTLVVLALLVVAQHRLPLVRVDRAVEAGWVVLLPLVLVQALVVAVVVLVTT